jgi:hypothetical protein
MDKTQNWYSISLIKLKKNDIPAYRKSYFRTRSPKLSTIHKSTESHSINCLLQNSLQTSLNSGRVSTLDLLNTFTLIVEVESRHGRDTVISSNLSKLVDVDLVEVDVGVGVAQLLEEGGDGLAGAAPCGEEVDDDGALGFRHLGLVLFGTIDESLACIESIYDSGCGSEWGGLEVICSCKSIPRGDGGDDGGRWEWINSRVKLNNTHLERGRREA